AGVLDRGPWPGFLVPEVRGGPNGSLDRAIGSMGSSGHQPATADHPRHPAAMDPEALAAECAFRATRRSGPGGQNRNKVETAVILTHRPTGIRAEASER